MCLISQSKTFLQALMERIQKLDKTSLVATQSSIYSGAGVDPTVQCKGSNAIDGIQQGGLETIFMPSNTDTQAWLQVDLLQDYLIREVPTRTLYLPKYARLTSEFPIGPRLRRW